MPKRMRKPMKKPMKKTRRRMAPLGSGGRFKALVGKIKASGKSASSAKAIAASIGRKKYGAKKMAAMAAAGRRRR